ncbi:MAG: TetR/AcrR family transcriptional regulator [Anaerolineales bacterium]|nr:TetR/AcrR family transcriptional regulator [Anaerolineales bacterium]
MSSGDPATRAKILETTRRLVEQSGGETVTMQQISEAAGVSRQALYLHFGSRVGLMVATAQFVDENDQFYERTEEVRQAVNGLAALEAFISFWSDYVVGITPLARVLIKNRDTDQAAAAAWADRMDALRNVCQILVEWLEQDGFLDPVWTVNAATDILWMMISIETRDNLVAERGWSNDEYEQRLLRGIVKILTV